MPAEFTINSNMFLLIPAIEGILHTFENVKIILDFDSSLFILHSSLNFSSHTRRQKFSN